MLKSSTLNMEQNMGDINVSSDLKMLSDGNMSYNLVQKCQ